MFPSRKLLLLKLKSEILNGMLEEGLKLLRSSEMLAHEEMKIPSFSFAQVCSNDHLLSQHSVSPFIEEMGYIRCHNGYNTCIDNSI